MSSTQTIPAVEQSVLVQVPVEQAFRVFTEETTAWWPLARHGVYGEQAAAVEFEPRVGGRLVERSREGGETSWGEISVWDAPNRIVLSWHPGAAEGDPATELEVRFRPEGEGTRVELEHRGWDALGDRAEASRSRYDSGWVGVLEEYRAALI